MRSATKQFNTTNRNKGQIVHTSFQRTSSLMKSVNQRRRVGDVIFFRNEQRPTKVLHVSLEELEENEHPISVLRLLGFIVEVECTGQHKCLEGCPPMWRVMGGEGCVCLQSVGEATSDSACKVSVFRSIQLCSDLTLTRPVQQGNHAYAVQTSACLRSHRAQWPYS